MNIVWYPNQQTNKPINKQTNKQKNKQTNKQGLTWFICQVDERSSLMGSHHNIELCMVRCEGVIVCVW